MKCILLSKPGALENPSGNSEWEHSPREILDHQVHATTISFLSHLSAFKKNCMVSSSNNCSAVGCQVVGVVGEIDSTTASIVHTLANRSDQKLTLVASSLPSTSLPVTNLEISNILDMNPLEHYIEALVSFTGELKWTRIGLISDGADFNLFAAEKLQTALHRNSEISIIPYIRVSKSSINSNKLLNQFKEYGTQVIVMLVGKELECLILSEALRLDFKWPSYALILFDFEPYRSNTCYSGDVLVLRNSLYTKNRNDSGLNMIQDSIMAVSLSQQREIFNMSFQGVSGIVKFRGNRRLINIDISNGNDTVLATYNPDIRALLNVNQTILQLGRIPQGSLLKFAVVPRSAVRITLVLLAFIFCCAITTMNLVLYICFRREPEIKATSVSVSMCLFVGCYMLLLFMPVHAYEIQFINHTVLVGRLLCNGLSWVSVIGLPFCLIFSTLFVKMLRIYAIFIKPHSYKKKLFSNYALLIYILVLVSPSAFHLLLWSLVDPFTKVAIKFPMKSGVRIYYTCASRHTLVWVIAPMVYYMAIIICLFILAVKTSKIRYKHFSDTKSTNAYAILSVFVFSFTILYWHFYNNIGTFFNADITLHIGHTVGTLLCQFILFVPKILLPTKRWLLRNKVKSKVFH